MDIRKRLYLTDELTHSPEYSDFLRHNRISMNRMMTVILFICAMAGPAIEVGIVAGIFPEVSFMTCIVEMLAMMLVTLIHRFVFNHAPESIYTGIFAMLAIEVLLIYLTMNHVALKITFFIVPILSILFCSTRLYLIMCGLSYVVMIICLWGMSPYYAEAQQTFATASLWFWHELGGYTIEIALVTAFGMSISVKMLDFLHERFSDQGTIRNSGKMIDEQLGILQSMKGIYSTMMVVDLENYKVVQYGDADREEMSLTDPDNFYWATNRMQVRHLSIQHIESFSEFTKIENMKERLMGRSHVAKEFLDTTEGWIRVQIIVISTDKEGFPQRLVYTVQNIDSEKSKEAHLVKLSKTDEMTGLYNRRSYEEDIHSYDDKKVESDLVIFSVDVNGLKTANDTLGHAAGDELLCGAAQLLQAVFGAFGKVYRTGGDEFMVLMHTNRNVKDIYQRLNERASSWKGRMVQELSVSVGYVIAAEYPDLTLTEMEALADKQMYKEKERYYLNKGIDRRGHQLAYDSLRDSYVKILSANLTDGTYRIVHIPDDEKTVENGFRESLYEWMEAYAASGRVHPDDLEKYRTVMNAEFLQEYFKSGEVAFRWSYRRLIDNEYNYALLEIVPADRFTPMNQRVYLYVKDIDYTR